MRIGQREWEVRERVFEYLVILPGAAIAQSKIGDPTKRVRISGGIIDRNGTPVWHATVALMLSGSCHKTASASLDQHGKFIFRAVTSRRYDIHFEAPGFSRWVQTVTAEKNIDLGNVMLEVAPIESPPDVPTHPSRMPRRLHPTTDLTSSPGSPPAAQPGTIAPIKTTLCELVEYPERFDGKIVRFRSLILIGFESFEVSASECSGRLTDPVWLEYGKGPERQPTTWCCGDMVPTDSLVLVQNYEFRRFHRYLTAQNRIDGCHEGDCYRYNVTATLTGRFDAGNSMCSDASSHCAIGGGFGHLGAYCSRLVIHSVVDVVAKPVPRSINENKDH